VNNFLNPIATPSFPFIETLAMDLNDSLFDGPSCLTKFFKRILVVELLMFHQHSITPKECACPLLWWKTNYHKWLNGAWLARHILVILGSQIETKQIFSVINIFTSL
jgi:hypothetical protein